MKEIFPKKNFSHSFIMLLTKEGDYNLVALSRGKLEEEEITFWNGKRCFFEDDTVSVVKIEPYTSDSTQYYNNWDGIKILLFLKEIRKILNGLKGEKAKELYM